MQLSSLGMWTVLSSNPKIETFVQHLMYLDIAFERLCPRS